MMKPRIRYGMVGGGQGAFIGAVHRMAARLDDQYELVCGALSSTAARSQQSGAELGLAPHRAYADYQTLFEREAALPADQRMQCVVIVTPNRTHLAIASAALDHGFHVLSDKPATATLAECRELAARLRISGLQYGLTHPYTAYPMVREAQARVASGALGTVRKVLVEYTQGWLAANIEQHGNKQALWRLDPAQAGISSCMADIGVHAFNLAEFVTGLEVRELCASLNSVVAGRKLDDDGTVLLRFDNGASGVLMASQVCVGDENNIRLRVYGDKASVDWQQMEPNSLRLRPLDAPAQLLRTAAPGTGSSASAATRIPAGHPEGYIEAFANVYREFAQQLRAAGSGKVAATPGAVPGIKAALRGMAFIEGAVASSAAGTKWQELPKVDA
ncbi:MAG: Gfo/Idh/MocA family oxidoreductase [Pseudomonadota bacterium]